MSIFSALESKPHEKDRHKKTEIIHVKPTAEGANTIHVYYGGTEVDNFTYQVCHCHCQCLLSFLPHLYVSVFSPQTSLVDSIENVKHEIGIGKEKERENREQGKEKTV